MKKFAALMLVFGISLCVQTTSEAVLLFDDPAYFVRGESQLNSSIASLNYGYLGQPQSEVFDFTIDWSDTSLIGTMYTSGPGDAGFAAFEAFLTDGINESTQWVSTIDSLNYTVTTPESLKFGATSFSSNGIDFAGYDISQLKVTINDLSPLVNGYKFTAGLQVYGDPVRATVPEPATLALLGSGLLGIGFRRRKRS
ncbi:MAG: PEP-CTERM sorting domain-containing protein [Candidatus Omnitrophica bacterium]|nr:PEP-CTERM sorting domain-containing protein [Candidatus Omnitrophota bacterium]